MEVNFINTWDGASLSEVREFIQSQLKKGYTGVVSKIVNGKVQITFKKADGTTDTVEFTAAEGSTEGYVVNFRMNKKQSIYGSGNPVAFNYMFSHTMDGEDVVGVAPVISFEAFTVDNEFNPVKSIWSTTINSAAAVGTVEIPSDVFNDISGNILIKGQCVSSYQGQERTIDKQISIVIATCEIDFGASFDLCKQVKGYTSNETMNGVLVTYTGTNNGELVLYVDGVEKRTVADVASGTTEDVTLSMEGLIDGMHTAQIIAKMDTGTVDEDNNPVFIYSKGLLFDFYKNITGTHVGIMMKLNSSDIIENPVNNLNINTEQYANTNIKYAASEYDNDNKVYKDTTAVGVIKDGVQVLNLAVGHTEINQYTFRDTSIVNYALQFNVTGNSRKINVSVNKNSSGVMVASGAVIDITCAGRNNTENANTLNTLQFKDNSNVTYTGILTNFNHNITQNNESVFVDGWDGESLIFKGRTQLDIPYAPFRKFSRSTGYYIEFNIKVDTILDDTQTIMSCLNSDGFGGFYLKPEEAGIITTSGKKVFTYIAANTIYNISFMVKNYTGTYNGEVKETTLLELYVNGIRTAVDEIVSSDSFAAENITMNGLGAIWRFYGMRVYNSTLTPLAIYNNYLTTLLDGNEIVQLAEANDILNTSKTAVDFQKLLNKGKNVLIIELGNGEEKCVLDSDYLGKLESEAEGSPLETQYIATKEQFLNPSAKKKANFLVKGLTYYNNGKLTDPHSFRCGPTLMQVQGTSSTYYSRKNYDIFFTGQKYNKSTSPKAWTSKFDLTIGSSAIENGNTTSVKYAMSNDDLGVPCLCLKADYSDSSNLHNTQAVTLINDTWLGLGTEYLTPPQYTGDTIHTNVRVGINGHPIDVFIKSGTHYEYIGQYNMNNEKKDSHHVYGFDGTTGNIGVGKAICVEFLENNTKATLFNADSSFNWETCSDTEDSEGNAIPQLEFRYPAKDWVDASQDLKDAAKRVFLWVKTCYDEFINSYNDSTGQYTSTKFVEEVKQYFNLKNLCSWYLYTEYFLAVDQRSKNMMLASWGATSTSGIWYFLPYDSDTILGVTNDGWLILPWDSDENTHNPMDITQYAYMGHDSTLWKLVRHYLYDDTYIGVDDKYGLRGNTLQDVAAVLRDENKNNVLFTTTAIKRYFDRGRKYWADIIYNFDSDTKYIAPLTYQTGRGSKSDFAQFVQGARDAHRDWLINKRFRLLDSKYACGFFETDEKNMKLSKGVGVAAQVKVIAKHDCYIHFLKNTSVIVKQKLIAGVETTIAIPTETNLGSNDPFKLQGFSMIESLDFDTASDYIYSDLKFNSKFNNLKTLRIVATSNNPAYNTNDLGMIVSDLVNIRNLTLKGFHTAQSTTSTILDLSKNMMLENVDVDCEALRGVTMPYSYHNIKKFNIGNLNIQVPWEFWNELNDYYTRTQNSCIFVGELVDRNANYTLIGTDFKSYTVTGKYVVHVVPTLSLGYGSSSISREPGYFGQKEGGRERGASNLKKIIYAKIDSSLINTSSTISFLYAMCTNLEYVNIKGWRWNSDDIRKRETSVERLIRNCKLTSYDLSFITLNRFKDDKANTPVFNNVFETNTAVTYIKYGKGWFGTTVVNAQATQICTQTSLNAQHYIDLAEDLPDISTLGINDNYRTLTIGENYNDFTKFPQTVRDKILAKGWLIKQ